MERADQILVNSHNGGSVVKLPAVVRSREDSHKLPFAEELVSILYNLVSSADEIQIMLFQKVYQHLLPEHVAYSPVRLSPSLRFFVRICPQEVAKQSCVWNISGSNNFVYLLQIGQIWRQSSMHAKYSLIDEGSDWKAVKAVSHYLPEVDTVSPLT